MSEIVPFLNAAAKRTNEALAEQKRAAIEAQAVGGEQIGAIENILNAIEGMQAEVAALVDLAVEFDKRIEKLEKAKPSRIISAR